MLQKMGKKQVYSATNENKNKTFHEELIAIGISLQS